MRPTGGYIKLYRAILTHPYFRRRPVQAWAFCILIMWCEWEDQTDPLPRQNVCLKRGQCATSARELGEELGIKGKKAQERYGSKLLASLSEGSKQGNPEQGKKVDPKRSEWGNFIRVEGGNAGTIITVLNYDEYQSDEEQVGGTKKSKKRGAKPGPKKSGKTGSGGGTNGGHKNNYKGSDNEPDFGTEVLAAYRRAYKARFNRVPRHQQLAACRDLARAHGERFATRLVVHFVFDLEAPDDLLLVSERHVASCRAAGLSMGIAQLIARLSASCARQDAGQDAEPTGATQEASLSAAGGALIDEPQGGGQ